MATSPNPGVSPHCYAFANRQLDTSDPASCNVPQYIQQAQLMKLVDADGVGYPVPTPHAISYANETASGNTAVN
jgi:hypothetical protein